LAEADSAVQLPALVVCQIGLLSCLHNLLVMRLGSVTKE